MCLVTLKPTPTVSDKDITCYKVLKYDIAMRTYYTPWTNTIVSKVNVINAKKPFHANGKREVVEKETWKTASEKYKYYEISGGFVHTYADRKEAETMLFRLQTHSGVICELWECTIPAGSEYFTGGVSFIDGYKSYASDKIVYEKCIEHKTIL